MSTESIDQPERLEPEIAVADLSPEQQQEPQPSSAVFIDASARTQSRIRLDASALE